MFLGAPNPFPVRFAPLKKASSRLPPLVLIHDGSGTTFSYFMLGNLHRDVWAIHNPKHQDGTSWDGGIEEMADHYVDLIKATGIQGSILLGGWSLGGYLSIAIARRLINNISSNITIAGLLIIDSPYHYARPVTTPSSSDFEREETPEFLNTGLSGIIQKSFENTALMLMEWNLPSWDSPVCGGKTLHVDIDGETILLDYGTVLYKPVGGSWEPMKTSTCYQLKSVIMNPISPPPAVIIRCTEPVQGCNDEFRDKKLLGWEGNYPEFIKAVIDINSEHFNLFDKTDPAKLEKLTKQINESLRILDNLKVVP